MAYLSSVGTTNVCYTESISFLLEYLDLVEYFYNLIDISYHKFFAFREFAKFILHTFFKDRCLIRAHRKI